MKELYWRYSLIVIVLGLGILLFIEFIPFLSGILGASTIYIMVRKQMLFLVKKKCFRRGVAAILLLIEAILCFLIPLSLFVWLFVNKVQDIDLNPGLLISSIERVFQLVEQKTGYDLFRSDIASIIPSIPKVGQIIMSNISSFVLNILVLIFVLYFMLIEGTKMEKYVYELLPFSDKNKKEVLAEINMIVKSNAIGIPLLAIIQGTIAMIGYIIFGSPDPFLFGVLTCFATVIPLLGTALIWFPLTLYMLLTGDWLNAVGLVVYALVIITNVDNLIRFILQKKMADIHPLITVFGVVIGLSLFGFMGIIFGPLLLSMFILCIDIFRKEFLEK